MLLYAAARRGIIARYGETYHRAVGEGERTLYETLTEGTASYYKRSVIVLKGSREDFSSGRRILIGHNYNSSVEEITGFLCSVGKGLSGASGSTYHRSAFGEELGGKLESSPEIAAAVVAYVEYKILHAFFTQLGNGILHLLCRTLCKAGDAYVAGGGVGHESLVDTIDRYVVASHCKINQFRTTFYLKTRYRTLGSAELLHHIGVFHLLACNDSIVGSHDAVAGEYAYFFRRTARHRLYHIDRILLHGELHADAAELAVERLGEFLGLCRCRICRVRVKRVQHGFDCLGDYSVVVDILHIIILDNRACGIEFLRRLYLNRHLLRALGRSGKCK